jgi:hypothetical protein
MRLGFFSCSTFVLAVFAIGCEEPVPPTPQGAFLVNFSKPDVMCPHKDDRSKMGVIDATNRTTVAVDGIKGAEIGCTVSGNTLGPFTVKADLQFEGTETLTVSIDKIDSKATDAAPAKGTVGFSSSITGGDFFGSNEPCDFYIEAAGPSGIGEGIKPGSAWLSFKCPSMVQSMDKCALNESYVLVENCTQ